MNFRTHQDSTPSSMRRHLDHYVYLFARKLWFILPVAIVVTIGWVIAMSRTGITIPELEAEAVLQFDNPDNFSAVDERVGIPSEGKAVLIRSRAFLERVVSELSLQLRVTRHPRSKLFDSVRVQADAPVGTYEFDISGDRFTLSFSDKERSIARQAVAEGSLADLRVTELPGVYLQWSPSYLAKPFDAAFKITRQRDAVDQILKKMTVKVTGLEGNILTVTLKGRDYELVTRTVNAIADDFSEENSITKRSRKGEVLEILGKQLETAREEMHLSEMALKGFREAHPTVGLPDAIASPATVAELEQSEADLRAALLQARTLKERYEGAGASKLPILGEMISFMSTYGVGTAAGLQSELGLLSEDARRFEETYSPGHPMALANQRAVGELGKRAATSMSSLVSELSRKISQNEDRVSRIQRTIAGLPAKELELANLQRRYNVNSDIYSMVLSRLNEARLAQAVEIGDVFVVDHAVTPEKQADFLYVLLTVGTGLFLGLAMGVGPVVTVDYFDGSARTERDLKRLTDLTLLESIPTKGSWNKSASKPEKGKVDEKLVSADYSHDFVDERYRQLRTKILLSLYEEKKKRIAVSSLNMGEGKSLTSANLAITMAQQRIPTVLIDGDLRRGVQHRNFGLEKRPGLSNMLMDLEPLTPVSVKTFVQKTHIENLSLVACGQSVPNSAELINSARFRQLLDALSASFDIIILDTPPIAVITDAIGVQDAFNRYIFVVKAAQTNINVLNSKIREFPGLRKKVLGMVFNGAPHRRPEYYQYTSYKY